MPDMLRTKVTSCLKLRLLSGSARCYKCRRAHGALRRELSEGGTESMTERDHRTGSGGVKDNVRDELAEAAGYRKEAAPEEEEQAGSGGGQGHCPGAQTLRWGAWGKGENPHECTNV
jgi:hypothetical protein